MKNSASLSMRPAQFIDPIFRKRDESRRYVHDPLTSKTNQSAARPSASTSSSSYRLPLLPSKTNHDKPPEVRARLSRESTKRERALELTVEKMRIGKRLYS